MDLTRYHQAEQLIHDALSGTISLSELQDDLSDVIWGIHPDEDPSLRRLAGPALLALAEWDAGHREVTSVNGLLNELLRSKLIVGQSESMASMPRMTTGTVGRMFKAVDMLRMSPAEILRAPTVLSEAPHQTELQTNRDPAYRWELASQA